MTRRFALAALTLASACAEPATPLERASGAEGDPAACAAYDEPRAGRRGQDDAATEISGLVQSRLDPRLLWAHNDDGGRAELLAIDRTGALRAVVDLGGAEPIDLEDLAIGPGPGDRPHIYLGDIGDNTLERD